MLALERPLGVVSDLALFGDHADPKRVYYIPTRPQLAKAGTAQELSFVKFKSADANDGGAGLLSFTTELAASDQQLERARDHLVREGIPEPLLAQVPWIGGKAVFAAALEEGDGFVEKLLGEVIPDLAATNRAMFSLRLTQEGAQLVEALVKMEGPNPLGVRYELEYAGLRPALDVRITADYKRIYKELSWGFQFGVAYEGIGVRAAVESSTQKLIQSGAIQIEVMHFTDDAALHARVDEAIRWFQDRLLQDFFKTALQPAAHENLLQKALAAVAKLGTGTLEDVLKDATAAAQLAKQLGVSPDALTRLTQGGGAGGGGIGGGQGGQSDSTFSLQLQFSFRDIKQEELKTLTLDWREARAERRTAAPQGLLSRIGGRPQIIEAQDSGTFFNKLNVTVRPLGDFATIGAQRMVVQLAYPDENAPDSQTAYPFETGKSEPKQFSAWTNGKPPRYRVRTEVHFDERGPWPGPPLFIGPWQTSQSLDLAVHPLSAVPRLDIEISPGTVSFTETPQVQINIRLDRAIVGTYMLTDTQRTAVFRRRLDAPAASPAPPVPPAGAGPEAPAERPTVEARITWFLAGGPRVEGEWFPVEGTALLVPSPWKSTRTVRLLPVLPSDFLEALVTLTLVEGSRSESVDVRFEPGERRAKEIKIPSLSEQPRPLKVEAIVIRGDGSVYTGKPVETSDPVVLVRDRDGNFRQVTVRLLAGPTLAGHGLMAVQVQLIDAAGDPLDSIVFTESQRNPGLLLVPSAADGPPGRYRIIRYALDGSRMEGQPQTITGAELLVPAVVKP
jgi:hypothetical protein